MGNLKSKYLANLSLLIGLGIMTACGQPQGASHRYQANPSKSSSDAEVSEPLQEEETSSTPQKEIELLTKQERTSSLPAYQIPEPVKQKIKDEQPNFSVCETNKFSVEDPHLHISAKTSIMTFTGALKIQGKSNENIEMSCAFDKKLESWECDDMFPTNPSIARERRLHATVSCVDANRCDSVALDLHVAIDGRAECQKFQSRPFTMHEATSGDEEIPEYENDSNDDGLIPFDHPIPATPEPKILEKGKSPGPKEHAGPSEEKSKTEPPAEVDVPKKEEKPTPEQIKPKDEPLTLEKFNEIKDDPNATIEIEPPIPTPSPRRDSEFSVKAPEEPKIVTTPKITPSETKDQAQGPQAYSRSKSSSLVDGQQLPKNGEGFSRSSAGNHPTWGADWMIDLLKKASSRAKTSSADTPITIATITKKGGGAVCGSRGKCHKSHRNGLDVDVAFPSTGKAKNGLWKACTTTSGTRAMNQRGATVRIQGTFCQEGKGVSRSFDRKRFWNFSTTFVCDTGSPVIAMFLDPEIKDEMCRYARENGADLTNPKSCAYRTLRAMRHEASHYNHVHIRVKCPGNRGCKGWDSIVTLGTGTGC